MVNILKIACIALVCLVGFGGEASAAKKIVLKFGGVNNTSHPCIRAINEKFTPVVRERSNGRVEVQVFDNSQLGGERDLMEQLQTGVLQMSYISPILGAIDPAINVIDLPFLFHDDAHVDEVIDGPIGANLLQGLPAKGLVPLGYFENGFRVVSNSKRPVNALGDLAGLKIRTPEAPISVAIFKALGANVTPLSFAELYSALQQQVVDGQENAYNTLTSSRFFEVQKYVTETNHMWGCFVILASAKWWNTLDQETKDAVAEGAKQASRYQRDIFREQTAASKKQCLDAGLTVSTPDLAEFRKATQPVYDDFLKNYPQFTGVVEQIRALR